MNASQILSAALLVFVAVGILVSYLRYRTFRRYEGMSQLDKEARSQRQPIPKSEYLPTETLRTYTRRIKSFKI